MAEAQKALTEKEQADGHPAGTDKAKTRVEGTARSIASHSQGPHAGLDTDHRTSTSTRYLGEQETSTTSSWRQKLYPPLLPTNGSVPCSRQTPTGPRGRGPRAKRSSRHPATLYETPEAWLVGTVQPVRSKRQGQEEL